jgi:hypothetical protein
MSQYAVKPLGAVGSGVGSGIGTGVGSGVCVWVAKVEVAKVDVVVSVVVVHVIVSVDDWCVHDIVVVRIEVV